MFVGKMSCHSIEKFLQFGVISSVLTTLSIVKIRWILYAKWNIWQINFNCVFVFALATPNSYIIFLHCNFATCYTIFQTESSISIYIEERELACFVYLCHHPRSQFTKLFTQAIFIGPYHCSHIFVPCLAFRVHVAGDLNKTISFV